MTRFQLAPVRVFLVMAVFGEMAFLTFATLSSVYRITEASLDPLQLVLVGTVLEATVFLFEVPAGIVADVYSRKLSLIIGFASIGAGFIGFQALSKFTQVSRITTHVFPYSATITSTIRKRNTNPSIVNKHKPQLINIEIFGKENFSPKLNAGNFR